MKSPEKVWFTLKFTFSGGDEISGEGDEISGEGDEISGEGDEISGGDEVSGESDEISGEGDEIAGDFVRCEPSITEHYGGNIYQTRLKLMFCINKHTHFFLKQ